MGRGKAALIGIAGFVLAFSAPGDRVLSGAGMGASAATLAAALTGAAVLPMAATGVVVGTMAGAFTKPGDIELARIRW